MIRVSVPAAVRRLERLAVPKSLRRRVFEYRLRLFGRDAVDLGPPGSGLQRQEPCDGLSMKAAAVSLSDSAVGDGGKEDGDLRPSGCSPGAYSFRDGPRSQLAR